MSRLHKLAAAAPGALLALFLVTGTVFAARGRGVWLMSGQNSDNTRYQRAETVLDTQTVGNLAVRWQFTTGGDVSATPAVDRRNVYVPDWAGNLYAINRRTGALVWQHRIPQYTGHAGDWARTTPAVTGDRLILGDQGGRVQAGAWVVAVSKDSGQLLWKTLVDSNPYAVVTQSAVVDTRVYVGLASVEETAATDPNYPCCTFRGSVVALDPGTGRILWRTYVVPPGYSGGAIWGSTPVIDSTRHSIYVATGNNYSLPAAVQTCVANAAGDPARVQACISPADHFDSVIALDAATGAVKWATRALPFDAWTVACLPGFDTTNCPKPAGADYDFGQGPALFTAGDRQMLGAGQKSGQYWAFNPDSGAVLWTTQVGPGGITGGLQWGSAIDGSRIYVAETNRYGIPWTLVQNGRATGPTVTSGFWSALDPATGEILWQTADPIGGTTQDPGPVSAAAGVIYACSTDPQGHMYALDGATGNILWSFASGGACEGGAAISGGLVFWGSGYRQFFTPNNKLFAFGLP